MQLLMKGYAQYMVNKFVVIISLFFQSSKIRICDTIVNYRSSVLSNYGKWSSLTTRNEIHVGAGDFCLSGLNISLMVMV